MRVNVVVVDLADGEVPAAEPLVALPSDRAGVDLDANAEVGAAQPGEVGEVFVGRVPVLAGVAGDDVSAAATGSAA